MSGVHAGHVEEERQTTAMSHITLKEAGTRDQQITSLPALRRAVARCGGVFKENQTKFRTWASDHGRLAGDYPLPEGYTADDVGKCEHAIGVPGEAKTGTTAYEIGVVKSKKFPGTFSLAYDFYGGTLDKAYGQGLGKLQMFYQMERSREVAAANNDVYTEIPLPNGGFRVEVDTTIRMGQ